MSLVLNLPDCQMYQADVLAVEGIPPESILQEVERR